MQTTRENQEIMRTIANLRVLVQKSIAAGRIEEANQRIQAIKNWEKALKPGGWNPYESVD